MNLQDKDILLDIYRNGFTNQRNTAASTGYSLGTVNKSIKQIMEDKYIDKDYSVTKDSIKAIKKLSPKNAVILAAGYGMRIESVNKEIPKGLLEVNGEILIERLIRQLKEVGVKKIYVIVGFLKEQYEYLIDEFGVELVVSSNYKKTKSLFSLNLVRNEISNTYIVPCDLYLEDNPFSSSELYSWYMLSDETDEFSSVRVNRKKEIVSVGYDEDGNKMIGIGYISSEDSNEITEKIVRLCMDKRYIGSFWEEALYNKDGKFTVNAKVVKASKAVEINTYEQLCNANGVLKLQKLKAVNSMCEEMGIDKDEIYNEHTIKRGVTNITSSFEYKENKYVMRIPEDKKNHIDRKKEKAIYELVNSKGLGDKVIYYDCETGYKISEYVNGKHTCNIDSYDDVSKSMATFRAFHKMNIQVDYYFDVFDKINAFEEVFKESGSAYRDYENTKRNVFALKNFIDKIDKKLCLTHMDASPENILLSEDSEEGVIIDWEYAAMQDPHMDIAIFAVRSLYDRNHIDKLIDIYFENECRKETRYKIYAYVAICGFMWSNWCEAYRMSGIDFGEYSLKQYRYAKEYSRIVLEYMGK